MYCLLVKDLSVFYGARCILSNINLGIEKNTVTSFLGVSGCGKSTLLRCFNRMNDYTPNCHVTGSIEFDGFNIYDKSVDPVLLRTKVGMVFQKPNPFPMSIYDNVAYGPRLHSTASRRHNKIDSIVKKSLEYAGLYDEVSHRLQEDASILSGGQQQRLCIARALAVGPEVILMDEPCSALDHIASRVIEKLIIELKKNFTIIVVTHSVKQASRVSDNVAFLSGGRLVEFGPASKVLLAPQVRETKEYVERHVNE